MNIATPLGCVSQENLIKVLQLYYKGHLNLVDESNLIDYLYKPIEEWYPNNTLLTLTQEEVSGAISQLPPEDRAVIEYLYKDQTDINTLTHYFVQQVKYTLLSEYVEAQKITALSNLSSLVLKIL